MSILYPKNYEKPSESSVSEISEAHVTALKDKITADVVVPTEKGKLCEELEWFCAKELGAHYKAEKIMAVINEVDEEWNPKAEEITEEPDVKVK